MNTVCGYSFEFKKVKSRNATKHEHKAWSKSELKKMFKYAAEKDLEMLCLIQALYFLALRIQDANELTFSQILADNDTITLKAQKTESRTVYNNAELQKNVRKLMTESNAKESDRIFEGPNGACTANAL
jgi:integrase